LNLQCSAVIPTYNTEKYITEAIDSLLLQSVQLSKIIVIDDASTDNTLNIINKRYSKEIYTGTLILHSLSKNAGVSNARNVGVNLVRTDWVLFMDADDTLHPDAVNQLLEKAGTLNNNPSQPYYVLHSAYQLINSQSKIISEPFTWKQVGHHETLGWLFYRNHIISPSGALVNRRAFIKLEGFDNKIKYNEDWDFWLRLAHNNSGIGYVDKTLVLVRRHDGNASNTVNVMHNAERKILANYSLDKIKSSLMQRECSNCKNTSDFVSILYRLGKWEDGFHEANNEKRLAVNNASLYFFTALYWIKRQNYNKALLDFLHCIKLSMHNGAVLNNIGATYLCLGENAQALIYLEKALVLHSNYMDAIDNKALLSYKSFETKDVKFTWRELRTVLTNYKA